MDNMAAIAIVFGAALVQSTFGFGAGLIAMPLLTLVLGLKTATPLFGLLGATMSALVVLGNWQQVTWQAVWRLAIATAIGIPLGVLLLKFAPASPIIFALGIFLIGFSVYRLGQWQLPPLKAAYWPYACGLLAGILGGAYNTNGPPVILYGTAQRWPPQQFRATLFGYFLPSGLITTASHAIAGLWQPETISLYWICLPWALIALALGQLLNSRLPATSFDQALSVLVGLLGGLLIWEGSSSF
ncbi:MAG: sulfite exporter TauE/SafE family protein [Spirulina sp. SIO3F2]|nr:sulfite exporter TauE/SafE family protein [Spirulina sp. SIO3F2]